MKFENLNAYTTSEFLRFLGGWASMCILNMQLLSRNVVVLCGKHNYKYAHNIFIIMVYMMRSCGNKFEQGKNCKLTTQMVRVGMWSDAKVRL